MTRPQLPNWFRIALSFLTVLSFLPQLRRLWLTKNSAGISIYYVLFNVIVATNQFTIIFALLFTYPGGLGRFTHRPITTGDWLNFLHVSVTLLVFLAFFALTIVYRPAGDSLQKRITISLYSLFLLFTIIPEAFLLAAGYAEDQYGIKLLELVLFIPISMGNLLATGLGALSVVFQARQVLQQQRQRSSLPTALSSFSLLAQAVVFAILATSWVWRVSWENPPSRIGVKQWFATYGWAVVQNAIFALVQFSLFCMLHYSGRAGLLRASSPMGQNVEVEPLLHGHF
ncbi:hypothetical protein BJX63DRAFT_337304 [Aspergillus granulosus]|uniref:Uncharacterized protein n=1 Tax=Aspergillus granulosus TaxID=176169 RepID=A0ABR4HX42_9EURO